MNKSGILIGLLLILPSAGHAVSPAPDRVANPPAISGAPLPQDFDGRVLAKGKKEKGQGAGKVHHNRANQQHDFEKEARKVREKDLERHREQQEEAWEARHGRGHDGQVPWTDPNYPVNNGNQPWLNPNIPRAGNQPWLDPNHPANRNNGNQPWRNPQHPANANSGNQPWLNPSSPQGNQPWVNPNYHPNGNDPWVEGGKDKGKGHHGHHGKHSGKNGKQGKGKSKH